jgi:hypothetical protein
MTTPDDILKYNYGRIVVLQTLSENTLMHHLDESRTPEGRARLEKAKRERAEREAADRPTLDAFLAELAALRAKYPDVKMFKDEYYGIEIVHGAARQWVETD